MTVFEKATQSVDSLIDWLLSDSESVQVSEDLSVSIMTDIGLHYDDGNDEEQCYEVDELSEGELKDLREALRVLLLSEVE